MSGKHTIFDTRRPSKEDIDPDSQAADTESDTPETEDHTHPSFFADRGELSPTHERP